MDLVVKFMIYTLIISEAVDFAVFKPLPNKKTDEAKYKNNVKVENVLKDVTRVQRQVVQPKWLTEPDRIFENVDNDVRITEQSLKEAAEIRNAIQQAVDEGTFAVPDEQNPNQATGPIVIPTRNPGRVVLTPSNNRWPFSFQAPPQWTFQLPENFPTLPPLVLPTPPPLLLPGQSNFWKEMRRRWEEFLENTRRMFRLNSIVN